MASDRHEEPRGASSPLETLIRRTAQPGRIRWIGLRPARRAEVIPVREAEITPTGLVGDWRATPGKRSVTLVQWEHLPVIAALAGIEEVAPESLRRNIAISGLNLLGLRKRKFRLGAAILLGTGLCAPCSRMEETLGHGGYAAVRGHGGITAEVVSPGTIALGDPLSPDPDLAD
ncbi:MAG: MOSC domain-containing protein [Pseudomonadota bacterium]